MQKQDNSETGKVNSCEDSREERLEEINKALSDLYVGKIPPPIAVYEPLDTISEISDNVNKLAGFYKELFEFSRMLSYGRLNIPPPEQKNYMAGFLKELHSQLLHLTWQAQQVAEGDYSQMVDFMGEFSKAFNFMIDQLKERESNLKAQVESITLSKHRIKKQQELLSGLVESLEEAVLVCHDGKVVFTNRSAQDIVERCRREDGHDDSQSVIDLILKKKPKFENSPATEEFIACLGGWLRISVIPMDWEGKEALMYVVSDITHIKNKEHELQAIANFDELTNVLNRRGGIAYLEEILRHKRSYPVSVCYVDIDNLKQANDLFGHETGDEYIMDMAKLMEEKVREKDFVARLGGDEFMIVLSRTSKADAEKIIGRIREDLAEYVKASRKPYKMDFSCGIATANEKGELDVYAMLNRADELMYRQKRVKKQK